MDFTKHAAFKYILVLLILFFHQTLLAGEPVNNKNTYLEVARTQLSLAFENHNKGDNAAAKENLKGASEWLYRAEKHSQSEKVKSEAKKLAREVDSFRLTLNKSSEKNDMARFWHQTTSLIKRETEHLIHSYTEQATHNRILKHLLDAKMHFYTAEHDIFYSHDYNDVTLELTKSLEYLALAEPIATPELKLYIKNLIASINELKSLSEQNKDAWKQDDLIHSLENAVKNLNKANSVASPTTRIRIESIKQAILKLKKDELLTSLKVKYDSIMSDFSRTINLI